MSILRISQFIAKEGHEDGLSEFLMSIVPEIERAAGCLSCEIVRGVSEPAKILVLERWESIEDHQASVADLDPDQVGSMMEMLAQPPSGEYFSD